MPPRRWWVLRLLAAAGMLAGVARAGGPPDPSAGCRGGTLAVADGVRDTLDGRAYVLDAPATTADRPLPLIVAMHGFRGNPDDLRAGAGFAAVARRARFAVVYPAGHDGVRLLGTTGRGWDLRPGETMDRDFVRRLLDHLEARRCLDRRRVYLTGMSNGGFAASLLGCLLADRVAAVAPVAGAQDLADCRPARPLPILLLYGAADPVVPPELVRGAAGWWARRNRCGAAPAGGAGCTAWPGCAADVEACEDGGGHRWPPDAADRIWAFFARHARP